MEADKAEATTTPTAKCVSFLPMAAVYRRSPGIANGRDTGTLACAFAILMEAATRER